MSADIVPARLKDGEGNDPQREQREKVDWALSPQARIVWMKSDVPAISIISVAQIRPIARCGKAPFGAAS